MRRPLQAFLGFMNTYVWRWAWMRVSWQEPTAEPGPLIKGTMRLHFPVRPSWLFQKKAV
jgi:hypothetical protein